MRAAVVREFGQPPAYGEFDDPTLQLGEVEVRTEAAAVSPLVLSRAAGRHYSASTVPPFVAGVDGVGRTVDGRRVYFYLPRAPFGSFAERAPAAIGQVVEVPEGMEAVTAAVAAVPGMSCWIPLSRRARVRPGEGVLVNGATGSAGSAAVQAARFLGAQRVIATGRNPAELTRLTELGATDLVRVDADPAEFRKTIRALAAEAKVGVVLDYLWGASAESILFALGGAGAPRGAELVRYVQVGSISGPTVSVLGDLLRSSGVEILGHGIGSATVADLMASLREFFPAAVKGQFRFERQTVPLAEVAQRWGQTGGAHRVVFTVP
jgi:NADPH:quinone reductase-like Zn-dependent oxidoreductase